MFKHPLVTAFFHALRPRIAGVFTLELGGEFPFESPQKMIILRNLLDKFNRIGSEGGGKQILCGFHAIIIPLSPWKLWNTDIVSKSSDNQSSKSKRKIDDCSRERILRESYDSPDIRIIFSRGAMKNTVGNRIDNDNKEELGLLQHPTVLNTHRIRLCGTTGPLLTPKLGDECEYWLHYDAHCCGREKILQFGNFPDEYHGPSLAIANVMEFVRRLITAIFTFL